MWAKLVYILSTIAFISAFEPKRINPESKDKMIIGGLFPIHHEGTSEAEPCGSIIPEKGIQRLEAMLFALDEINKNFRSWNINLGAMIMDTCSSDSFALEQSLQFLQTNCGDQVSSKKRVVGVVGAAKSAVSESVANIFRLFKIPQVSYASTSEELDNMHKYKYFFRVVPSDRFQVQAILDILVHFKWTYISAVVSKGDYGEVAMKSLQGLIDNGTTIDTICFAEVYTLPRNPMEEDYNKTIQSLKQHKNAKVVIVFLNEDKVKHLLTAARKTGVPRGRFIWLGSDGWGAKMHIVKGNEEVADGAITVLPKRFPMQTGFDEYFLSLKPETNIRNPWFKEFWEHQFNCTFNDTVKDFRICTGKEELKGIYHQEGLVPMVIDSVYLIATAIRSLCQEIPQYCTSSTDKDIEFRKQLTKHILKTSFKSSQGHGVVIKFDSERQIPTYYKIYQYHDNSNGKFAYKAIGEWSRNKGNRLSMVGEVTWDGIDPVSICSEGCKTGEERIVKDPSKRCCWECQTCKDEEYVPHNGHCTSCPTGFVSNDDRTDCREMELDYIGRSLISPWAFVPFSFAIFGLVTTFIVLIVFLLFHKTPIIMAAGRELCYVILFGVSLCYCFTFVVLAKPSTVSCGMLRTGVGLGLSICYAAIFTKTNRISRIFNRNLDFRIIKRPSYISPESQLVICSCLIFIQLILSVMWLILTPATVKNIRKTNPSAYVSFCRFDGTSVLLALLYNILLIILCTYYAYKTRNIPENFNESKYISFTMYASCVIWLAFIPIYYSTWQDFKVQLSVLCMSVNASGSVILVCLFLPKIYIVLFHPEKNVRYPSSSPNGSTPSVSAASMRFFKSNQSSPVSPQRIIKNTGLRKTDNNFLMVNKSSTNLSTES